MPTRSTYIRTPVVCSTFAPGMRQAEAGECSAVFAGDLFVLTVTRAGARRCSSVREFRARPSCSQIEDCSVLIQLLQAPHRSPIWTCGGSFSRRSSLRRPAVSLTPPLPPLPKSPGSSYFFVFSSPQQVDIIVRDFSKFGVYTKFTHTVAASFVLKVTVPSTCMSSTYRSSST